MKKRITVPVLLCIATFVVGALAQESDAPSVQESFRDTFRPGYAYAAETYNESDIPGLLAMLNSEDEQLNWPNVAWVLGVIGDEQVAEELIAIIEKPGDGSVYIPQIQHDTRAAAMRALGFLAGKTGSQRILDYLIDSLDDGIWRRRNLSGVVDYLDTYDRYDRQMSIYAVFGLALSGHPRAGAALRSLQMSATPNQARLREGLDGTLDTWLEIHDLVAERGVVGMYEETERRSYQVMQEAEQRLRENGGGPFQRR